MPVRNNKKYSSYIVHQFSHIQVINKHQSIADLYTIWLICRATFCKTRYDRSL